MFVLTKIKIITILVLLSFASLAFAKEAVPLSADPELEKKVNEIASELRCLVCQNQTIADSHAGLAIDLKNQVREMVREGKTKDDINEYMVARYGDFVRYRPPMEPKTYFLWIGPFFLLVGGILLLVVNLKRRKAMVVDTPLSEDDHQKLESLLHAKENSSNAKEGEGR